MTPASAHINHPKRPPAHHHPLPLPTPPPVSECPHHHHYPFHRDECTTTQFMAMSVPPHNDLFPPPFPPPFLPPPFLSVPFPPPFPSPPFLPALLSSSFLPFLPPFLAPPLPSSPLSALLPSLNLEHSKMTVLYYLQNIFELYLNVV